MKNEQNIVIYQNGEIELKVSVNNETIWLRQDEISKLFEKDRTVITRHINNILKDKEVNEKSNVQKMHFANSDKLVKLYSLDIILAVGYRTNSAKAIKFRQWATNILRNYILDGYAINTEKITNQRFKDLENDVYNLETKLNEHDNKLKQIINTNLPKTEGIFYNGQIFHAYVFVSNLIKTAKNHIVLIDNYIDESVLLLLSKRNKTVDAVIYTSQINKQLKLDIEKHKQQYPKIKIKTFKKSHDRFLIIDNKEVYHIGASLKDLGKKWFAFSKINLDIDEIINKLS